MSAHHHDLGYPAGKGRIPFPGLACRNLKIWEGHCPSHVRIIPIGSRSVDNASVRSHSKARKGVRRSRGGPSRLSHLIRRSHRRLWLRLRPCSWRRSGRTIGPLIFSSSCTNRSWSHWFKARSQASPFGSQRWPSRRRRYPFFTGPRRSLTSRFLAPLTSRLLGQTLIDWQIIQ